MTQPSRWMVLLLCGSLPILPACLGKIGEEDATGDLYAPRPLVPPTQLAAAAQAPTRIALIWAEANTTESGYEVERSVGTTTAFTRIGLAAKNATGYIDASAAAGTTYQYRVRAYRAGGGVSSYSSYSATASATTPSVTSDSTAPSVPAGLAATAPSSTAVALAWSFSTDTGSGLARYRIFRDGGYIAEVEAPVTSYGDGGRSPSTTYGYAVSAVDHAGNESARSSSVSVTTPSISPALDYGDEVLADSPVAYWRLGEGSGTTAADERGSYPATYLNGPTLGSVGALAGDSNTAVTFNGTSQYVERAFAAGINPASTFTLEAWVRPSASSSAYHSVMTSRESTTGVERGITVYSHAGRWELWTGNGTGNETLTGPAVAVNQWTHLAVTYNGTQATLYVNGQAGSPLSMGYVANASKPLRIGAGATEGAAEFHFPGRIDEVAIYPAVLSAARIQAHFSHGLGTVANTAPSVPALVSPANAASGVSLSPTLTATFADPDAGDTGQVSFRVCADASCATVKQSLSSTAGLASGDNGSATVTLAAGLQGGTTYYWQARNQDAGGLTSSWSGSRSFTTTSTPVVYTFRDEFDGTSVASHWKLPGDPFAAETDSWAWSQATVAGGMLSLAAVRTSPNHWISGALDTVGTFQQRYGWFEARIQIPKGHGLWPAFWAISRNGDGSFGPSELDMMEILANPDGTNGGDDVTRLIQTVHRPDGSQQGWGYDTVDLSLDYHVYGMEWRAGYVDFYLDGVMLHRYTGTMPTGEMVVVLNLGVGGDWAGPSNSSTPSPSVMLVDWVRVRP